MPLTIAKIAGLRPGITPSGRVTGRPYKVSDSGSLYLEVTPEGSTRWRFRYRFGGKGKLLSMGVYPEVGLNEARGRRDEAKALLARGIDPSDQRKADRAARRADEARGLAAMRFALDSDGALSFVLGKRRLALTPSETVELRAFLDVTRAVTAKVPPCP